MEIKKKCIDLSKIFNQHDLKKINIEFILTHFAKLLTLYCYLEKEDEFFLILKDYTEII